MFRRVEGLGGFRVEESFEGQGSRGQGAGFGVWSLGCCRHELRTRGVRV
jgi:hypothetical protein